MDPEPAEQGLRQAQRDVSVILHVFQCSTYSGDDSGRVVAFPKPSPHIAVVILNNASGPIFHFPWFDLAVKGMVGKRLTFDQLTGKTMEAHAALPQTVN